MDGGKILDQTRELALADSCVDIELNLTKKPRGSIYLDDDVQPFGPSAPIRDLHVGNARYDDKIEKAYYDTDLRATQAVVDLYNRGVIVSKIQKAFSVGAFGVEKKRRLVPTRWSITAVDDIISKNLREKVKTFPEINEYRVYESIYMDNVFEILMIPCSMELRIHGSMVSRYRLEPRWNKHRYLLRLGRQQRTHNLRPNRWLLLLCTLSRLRTTQKRKTPSHCNRSTRSQTRLHHANRRLASPRKRAKRHAPKTLPCSRISPNPSSSSAADLKFQCNGGYCKVNC